MINDAQYEQPTPVQGLADALLASLSNPQICDLTLIGTDGGRVPAMRSVLSSRSEVLERMLVGHFRESEEREIELPYESAVLNDIVRYCCADILPTFLTEEEAKGKPEAKDEIPDKHKLARQTVHSCAAADYYELGGLSRGLINRLAGWFFCRPVYACAALDEALKVRSASQQDLVELCLMTISSGPKDSLYSDKLKHPYAEVNAAFTPNPYPGVSVLSVESLCFICEDRRFLPIHAYYLLKALESWNDHYRPENISSDEFLAIAKDCASKLDLRVIPLGQLLELRTSILLDKDAALDALAFQNQEPKCYITGSIIPGVNGMYELARCRNEDTYTRIEYTKEGVYNGEQKLFGLREVKTVGGTADYILEVRNIGDDVAFMQNEGDQTSSIMLYEAKNQNTPTATSGDMQEYHYMNSIMISGVAEKDYPIKIHFIPRVKNIYSPHNI